jgi:mannosyltransferase
MNNGLTNTNTRPIKRWQGIAVISVLLLSALLRFSGAGHNSTWSDEGWNLWAIEGNQATVLTRLAENHHPPAYYLSLDAWQQIAGDNKLSLRLLTVLGGILTTALIYRIGADHFSHITGIFAATVFAVFEQPIYYSQSMRHYGWLVLGVCLMMFFFLRLIRRPKRLYFIAYGLSVAFSLYTMYLAVFVIAVQGFFGVFVWRASVRTKVNLISAYALAGLLLLPWLVYALPQQWAKVQRGIIAGYPNSFPTTLENALNLSDLLLGGQFVVGAVLCTLAVIVVFHMRRTQRLAGWLILASGLGLFWVLLLVNLFTGILAERTVFFLTPAIALTLGIGFSQIQPHVQLPLIVALLGWMILTPQGVVPRINSVSVAETIAAGYNPGDMVLLETGFDDVAFEYELSHILPEYEQNIFRSYYLYDYPDDSAMMQQLDEELSAEQRVWLVYWNVPQRMADKLRALGFQNEGRWTLPMGEGDIMYERYPTVQITLFTRPDAAITPIQFGDVFTLHDAVHAEVIARNTILYVDLWWSIEQVVDRDYSFGVLLRDASGGGRVENFELSVNLPTSQWQPDRLYFDRRALDLSVLNLPMGEYQLLVNAYWYQTPESPLQVDGENYAILGTIRLE